MRITSLLTSIALILSLFIPGETFAISIDEETKIGREADKEIMKMYELYDSDPLQKYVSSVGNTVVKSISNPEFKFTFKVVQSSEVNAFALPGGFIYITTGILAVLNSEAELAGLLGHEIGHVTSHHAIKQQQKAMVGMLALLGGIAASIASPSVRNHSGELLMMTNSLLNQILLGYGKEAELESDRLGLIYSYNAGYNPDNLVVFLKNLRFQEMLEGRAYHGFYATHPDTKKRIIEAYDMAASLNRHNETKKILHDNYLRQLKGLKYGGPKHIKDKKGEFEKRFIDIYTAKGDETIRSIAEKIMKKPKESFRIAIINGKKEDTLLKKGELVKIIVNKRSLSNKKID